MSADLVSPNVYMVYSDGDQFIVRVEWDRTDEEVVLKCLYHKLHMAISSKKVPPCFCIADVLALREEAKLTDSKD
jgi:hypothetical protein